MQISPYLMKIKSPRQTHLLLHSHPQFYQLLKRRRLLVHLNHQHNHLHLPQNAVEISAGIVCGIMDMGWLVSLAGRNGIALFKGAKDIIGAGMNLSLIIHLTSIILLQFIRGPQFTPTIQI